MKTLSFKAAQLRRDKAQSMVNNCCNMSRQLAQSYLNNSPQQYFNQRCDLAMSISEHLIYLRTVLHFQISDEECRSLGAILSAWPNTAQFNKALLIFRYEYVYANHPPEIFRACIDEYVNTVRITRTALDGILSACLISFTCCVADAYIESLAKSSH